MHFLNLQTCKQPIFCPTYAAIEAFSTRHDANKRGRSHLERCRRSVCPVEGAHS